jgi:hypothetical protein
MPADDPAVPAAPVNPVVPAAVASLDGSVGSLVGPAAAPSAVGVGGEERRRRIAGDHDWNLLVLSAHHVLLRVGWIFKTESVMMPAFLDAIAGAGWVRGWLPVLNRFGQSVPPLFFADRIQHAPQKKRPLILLTVLMSVPFLALAALWQGLGMAGVDPTAVSWLPLLFLSLYAVFFSATGLSQLSFGTLQGKLIRADRRGRLETLSGLTGAICAILCAWFLLRDWLRREDGGFGLVFGTTGAGFILAGLVVTAVREPSDSARTLPARPLRDHFRLAWRTARDDRPFGRLVLTGMLFIATMMLFPHYQALGRERLGTPHTDLLYWLIAQNAGAGLFSVFAGTLADRFGNRLAIRWSMAGAALTPLLALAIAFGVLPGGRSVFWTVFFLLGLTPMTVRILTNYTLEMAHEHQHARYLSTLKLGIGAPILLSPLVGLLVDGVGFTPVFLAAAASITAATLMTFRLPEPRHQPLATLPEG